MKNLLKGTLACLLLGAPALVFAAYNDVTLTDSAIISLNGASLTLTSSTAVIQSITVGSTNFSVVLRYNSDITIQSSNRFKFTYSASPSNASYTAVKNCTTGSSSLELTSTDSSAVTITVTPNTSETCSTNTGGGGGPVGGGGGGGGGYTPPATPAPAAPSTPAASVASPVALSVSPVFNSSLSKGTRGADVKRLQVVLNSSKDTQVAVSGLGSPGQETTYFGPATMQAVQKFQLKYGIAKKGDSGFGVCGPKTRAKIKQVFAK